MRRYLRRGLGAVMLMSCAAAGSHTFAATCPSSPRPIVFVHGSGLSSATWDVMSRAFIDAGWPAELLLLLDMQPTDGSNSIAASRYIAPAIDKVLNSAKARDPSCLAARKVDLIAHSMGAVSARWYVAKIDASKVRNLIGIAPANHGSNALCGLGGAGNRELCPAFAKDPKRNAVQVQLNGSDGGLIDETPFGLGPDDPARPTVPPDENRRIAYTTIRLDPDEWIVPGQSAILAGAGGLKLPQLPLGATETSSGNILWPRGASHDELPRDPRLVEFIVKALLEDVE